MAEAAKAEPAALQLVKRLDAKIEGGRARAELRVEPLERTDEGEFEYVAIAKVPSQDLQKETQNLTVTFEREVTRIEIFLLERRGEAHDEIPYEVTFPDGEKRPGVTDGGGYLTEEKEGKVDKIKVKYTPPGAPAPVEREVWIDLGDPATEEGLKRRLQNLGYTVDPLAQGIREFEIDHDLPPDGEIDEELRRAVTELHDRAGLTRPSPDRPAKEVPDAPAAEEGGGKAEPVGQTPAHPPIPPRPAVEPPPAARDRIDLDVEVRLGPRRLIQRRFRL